MSESTAKPITVAIGIQARSTSERLPQKITEIVGGKSVIHHVVDAALQAAWYTNNWNTKRIVVSTSLLIPVDDPVGEQMKGTVEVFEGSEHDVLSRYAALQAVKQADYVVRVTGDCPLIPPFVISKHITLAVMNRYDYISNSDPECRTSPDGFDCEVISGRLLAHVNKFAMTKFDREHVTTHIKSQPPTWAYQGCMVNFLNLSSLKLSIDTRDDLERIRENFSETEKAHAAALKKYGRNHVHKF